MSGEKVGKVRGSRKKEVMYEKNRGMVLRGMQMRGAEVGKVNGNNGRGCRVVMGIESRGREGK